MQSEKNGKTITHISFNKNEVVLTFNNDTKIKLSLDTYSNFYLYKGKELSINEEHELLFESELAKIKAYVLNLLSQKLYSEKEIKDKLLKRKCSDKVIDNIILYLKEHRFIDDQKYIKYLVEEYERKKYGSRKIINKLHAKGISNLLVNQLHFDEKNEEEKSNELAYAYLKRNKNKSFVSLKQSLYAYLVSQGFELDVASKSTEKTFSQMNKEDEKEILLNLLKKYVIIHQVDLTNNLQKEKIIKKYLLKGYKYNLIKEVLEELWKN